MIQTNKLDTHYIKERAEQAWELLHSCSLCPQHCGVNRLQNEKGNCITGKTAIVSSAFPHLGEENCIRGFSGSGTIFFSGCNLDCAYCQNYTLSQQGEGQEMDAQQIAQVMLALQREQCHNINWVTPTHVIPQILDALTIAVEEGFHLPIVYNSGGYDSHQTLKLLDGIVDIYMPDFKYANSKPARELSNAADYPQVAREAIREMHRQTGDLTLDSQGLAIRGLLVRHLVLPNGLVGSKEILEFLANEISTQTAVNIMGQYHPCFHAHEYDEIRRPVRGSEIAEVKRHARELRLRLM